MNDRNWDAEMAKIDKQLASVSDEQLMAGQKPNVTAAGKAGAKPVSPAAASPPRARDAHVGGSWYAWLKVLLAVIAAGGLMYWPWPARCGLPVVGFTAATGSVVLLGVWSAIGTWRHRLGLAHFASLLVIVWGGVLGAREVLPRLGYAVPSAERPSQWSCDGLVPLPPSNTPPNTTPATVPTPPPTGAAGGQATSNDPLPPSADVPVGPPPA